MGLLQRLFCVLWPQWAAQEVVLKCSKKAFSLWKVRPAKHWSRLLGGHLGGHQLWGVKNRLNRSSVPGVVVVCLHA